MNIAIVTGASSGLGGCFARGLDKRENLDEIWIIARREERLIALAKEMNTKARVIKLDLAEKDAPQKLETLLKHERPNVRVLINAAGFGKIGRYDDIPLADCENMIDVNCRAAVAITQIALPYMTRGARIIEVCSTAAFQPLQFLAIYAASKAFLYRYSRALRIELLPRFIKVTAVCPYWIKDTEFIGVAKNTKNSSFVHGFPLASRENRVAKWALVDSKIGLAVSTPGPICMLHRLVAKFIPSEIMMGIWEIMRRI